MSRIHATHFWLRLTLLLSLLANVVACNRQPAPVVNPTATSPSIAAQRPKEESDRPVVITFAGYEWERQLYEPLIAEFHEQAPAVTVQFVALPDYSGETQDADAQSADIQGADADYLNFLASSADTVSVPGFGPGDAAAFIDLTPLAEADPAFQSTDFWPALSNACHDADGHRRGILVSANVRGVFYDAKAFDDAGLQHPAPGWTWDDFRAALTALAKTEGETTRYGYAERFGAILSPWIEAVLAESGGEIDSEALQPIVQWYLNGVKSKAIRPTPDYTDEQFQDDWESLFQSENRPAMWAGSLGDALPGADSLTMVYDEYGFAPYPIIAGTSPERSTPAWVQCLAISSGSQNSQAAWQWLDFLSRHWLVSDRSSPQVLTTLPGRRSVAEAEGYWRSLPADLQPTVRNILEQSGYADSSSAQTEAAVSQALSKAAAGEVDFALALQEAIAQQSQAVAVETPASVATPRPTVNPDATVIAYYFDQFAGNPAAVEMLAEKYQQSHSDVTINVSIYYKTPPDMDYNQALNENFDCMTIVAPAQQEYFMPLNALFDAEDAAFRQDFDPAFLNRFRQDGVLYALPAASQPSVIVYNVEILARRGLQPPSFDWTFDDYAALIMQVASADEADRSYGTISSGLHYFLLEGRGVTWVDMETAPPTPKFDSPEVASALAWLDDLIQSGVVLTDRNDDTNKVEQNLQGGRVAFWMAQMGHLGEAGWLQAPSATLDFPIGILPLPIMENPTSSNDGLPFVHFISSQSKNQRACWDWIKFLSEQPALFDGVPARKSVAESPGWEAFVGQENAEVYRLTTVRGMQGEEEQSYFDSLLVWPFDVWQSQIMAAMMDGEDYTALLPLAQAKAERYLACMGAVEATVVEATVVASTALDNTQLYEAANQCAKQSDPGWEQ